MSGRPEATGKNVPPWKEPWVWIFVIGINALILLVRILVAVQDLAVRKP